MTRFQFRTIVVAVLVLIVFVSCRAFLIGHNNNQNYQIKQSLGGEITVVDKAGIYGMFFSSIWTYPKAITTYFSEDPREGSEDDESITAIFNDGGSAKMSTMIRYQTPIDSDLRIKAHRDFAGNLENMESSIRAQLINVVKATAPLMSSSENQSARKSEFTQLINEQLVNGLYKMRKVEKILKDRTDENGKPITVWATEIILDKDNQPIIAQISPLKEYGIKIQQFSVTGTTYDAATQKQFASKKESFQLAEKSKAEREQEVQKRLMIEEKGLREKAEVEAIALKDKAQAVIAAQKKKEVAELEGQQKVVVAKLDKEEAETRAQKSLAVAKLDRLSAVENAEAIRVLAIAEEERIKKAGAITEKEKILAEIEASKAVRVAEQLSKVKVPEFIITGGGGANGSSTMEHLINLKLLESAGIIDGKVKTLKK